MITIRVQPCQCNCYLAVTQRVRSTTYVKSLLIQDRRIEIISTKASTDISERIQLPLRAIPADHKHTGSM